MRTFYTEKSSRLVAMEYDEETQDLRVTFKRGGVYMYHEVPEDIFDAVIASDSAGKAFDRLIKHKYQFNKLS